MARPVGAPNGFERVERALTSLAAVDSCDEQWQLDVLHGAQDRDQVVELEDESHAARAVVRALAIRHLGQRGSVDEDLAVVDRVEAGEAVEKGGLPAAARPHDGDHLAWLEDEVDTPERVDTDDTRVIGLAKGARLDDRNVHRDSPLSSLAASYDRACGASAHHRDLGTGKYARATTRLERATRLRRSGSLPPWDPLLRARPYALLCRRT